MEKDLTYRQDTTQATNPLIKLQNLPETGGLNIERNAPVPLTPLPETEPSREKTDTTPQQAKPSPPTPAQLRYWWWQRENNLLVGESRYIEPRNELQVQSETTFKEISGLKLPERHINSINYDWVTLILILALIFLASVRITWSKYLVHLFQSVVNYSTSYRMFQEKNSSLLQGAFRLDLIFYLVFSVFVFQLFVFFKLEIPYHSFYLYLVSLAIVLFFLLLKKALYKTFGFIINKTEETSEYLFNLNNFNRVTGLLLLPVIAIIAFYPFPNLQVPVIIGITITVFLYFILLSRGFVILLKKQFSIFYLFLYFCTLEFLPLVLLYKILVV